LHIGSGRTIKSKRIFKGSLVASQSLKTIRNW